MKKKETVRNSNKKFTIIRVCKINWIVLKLTDTSTTITPPQS